MRAGFALCDVATELPKVFEFLTCELKPLVKSLQPKAMPVILHESDYQCWLSGSLAEVIGLAAPFPVN